MTRLVRRVAALIALAALAFAQLATSAYACPSGMPEPVVAEAPEGCGSLLNPNLCERHCDYGASSVQVAPLPAVVPDAAPLPWRAEPFLTAPAIAAIRERVPPAHIEPPPLVLFGVLRI